MKSFLLFPVSVILYIAYSILILLGVGFMALAWLVAIAFQKLNKGDGE